MISVENFYWVLYENLLEPLEIDAWYYYPWGTTHTLCMREYQIVNRRRHFNHVLFYDQEPVWNDNLGAGYDTGVSSGHSIEKFLKILANSEKSDIIKEICKTRKMINWYYFYHGFAALDWYHDAQYIRQDQDVDCAFISFNHVITHSRNYRIALLARLINRDIVQRGNISWHADHNETMRELENPHGFLSDISKRLCHDSLQHYADLPCKIDQVVVNGNLSAHFGYHEFCTWQRSLLHVVNETVFYQAKLHLTEKTFKPIVAQRPFVLVAAPGNLAYLRSYGFKTFAPWIDESYDNIQDPDDRLDAVADEVAKFAAMSVRELKQVHREMQSVLDYNKQHFFKQFRHIIVNELVDNFDQCIRIWNNGRVDGRELPLPPDLDQVKKILLS